MTTDVINRFNQAFANHDGSLLAGIVGQDCVMEAIQPDRRRVRHRELWPGSGRRTS